MKFHRRQRGYTLLEMVIAFAILALSLGVLYESFSMTLKYSEKARNLSRAELLAESVKERLGIDLSLAQTIIDGHEEDCGWQVRTQSVLQAESDRPPILTAKQVAVDVSCGGTGAVGAAHLDTVELVGAR